MSSAALAQDDLKALEQTRQRLYQLTNNIASLRADVARSNPLPQWSSLQTSASILVTNVQTLTTHLANNAESLNRIAVYPATNYPGRTQEPLLGQLLRKKLEPAVEGWVDEGRAVQPGAGDAAAHRDEDDELWDWAAGWVLQRIAGYVHSEIPDNFTAEERAEGVDNVRTGLRRTPDKKKPKTLEEEEDEDEDGDEQEDEEEDEDEEMEDAGAGATTLHARSGLSQLGFGMGPVRKDPDGRRRTEDDILKFATSGTVTEPSSDMR